MYLNGIELWETSLRPIFLTARYIWPLRIRIYRSHLLLLRRLLDAQHIWFRLVSELETRRTENIIERTAALDALHGMITA